MVHASLGRTIGPRVKGLLETVTFDRDLEESLSFQGGEEPSRVVSGSSTHGERALKNAEAQAPLSNEVRISWMLGLFFFFKLLI